MSIEMGNDEFILYIRKTYLRCRTTNDVLGKKIWEWIGNKMPNAEKIKEDESCYWENMGDSISDVKLPKTAAQFSFSRNILPELYDYLDELGRYGG